MLTGDGLSEYARVHLGTPYFYGAKIPEGALTENKMSTMHRMYPKVVTTSYMAKARRKGQVGKVNVDENPELAEKFGIMSIPTLLVFKDGKLVKSAVGLHDKGGLAEMVK